MVKRRLKAAVIGCGRMGALTTERTRNSVPAVWMPLSHTDAISAIENIDLVAVCDASREQAAKVADTYPGAVAFVDHLQMLNEVKPDIVGIATRTEGRCNIIRDCAVAGVKGIHSEKPMARSLQEADIAISALKANGVGFTFGAVRRYMSPYILARKVAESGDIGDIRQIVIEHGSDMLLWGHPHTLDLALFFNRGALASRVQSRLQLDPADINGNTVDVDPVLDMAYIEFNNGVSVQITSGTGFNVRVYGSTGSVSVIGDGSRVELRKKAEGRPYELDMEELEFDDRVSGTQQAFLNLAEYIANGTDTGLSLDEVDAVNRLLIAVVESEMNEGRAVNPTHVNTELFVTGRFGDLYA